PARRAGASRSTGRCGRGGSGPSAVARLDERGAAEPYDAVRVGGQACHLGAVAGQVPGPVEVDDRVVLLHLGDGLPVELAALGGVADGRRAREQVVDLLVAVPGVVVARARGEEVVRVAVR